MSIVPSRLALLLLLVSARANGEDRLSADAEGALAKVAADYHIEIVVTEATFPVKTAYGVISGKKARRAPLESYAPLFAEEFSLYPPDLVKRSRLKRVVLCEELAFAGQRRNAIPDYEHDALYLEVSRGDYDTTYLRKVIHHEFFHVIDFRDDGLVNRDDAWSALNPAGFKYGNGGQNAQDEPTTSLLTDKFPGFLNHYSTTAVEEDKAEMFANLIVGPSYVERRAKKDAVIRAKVERMRLLLAAFCADLDSGFWERVRKKKRADR